MEVGAQVRVGGFEAIHGWMMKSGELWGGCAACFVDAPRSERW